MNNGRNIKLATILQYLSLMPQSWRGNILPNQCLMIRGQRITIKARRYLFDVGAIIIWCIYKSGFVISICDVHSWCLFKLVGEPLDGNRISLPRDNGERSCCCGAAMPDQMWRSRPERCNWVQWVAQVSTLSVRTNLCFLCL